MNRTLIARLAAAVALSTLAAGASAHRPWMLPSATFVEGTEPWVAIDGAVSEGMFYFDHVALRMDGVTVTAPDGSVAPLPANAGRLRSTAELKMAKDGTYRISLVTQNVMASYKLGNEVKRFRGSEEAFARDIPAGATEVKPTRVHQRIETFVTANKPNDTALKPSGTGLELVPLTHPNDLRTGETARWRFLLDGKPMPNLAFSLVPGGVKYRGTLGEIRLVTDANGEAAFKLPAPNMYWVSAGYPAVQQGEAPPPRRYSYVATLEVLPE